MKPVSRRAKAARVKKYLFAAMEAADTAFTLNHTYGWGDTLAFIAQAEKALAAAKEAIATPETS